MAFEPQQIDTSKINGGNEYSLNNALTPQDMNNIVKGIAYNSSMAIIPLNAGVINIKSLSNGIYKITSSTQTLTIYYDYANSQSFYVNNDNIYLVVNQYQNDKSWFIPIVNDYSANKSKTYVGYLSQYGTSTYNEIDLSSSGSSITLDTVPTQGSTNGITSGAVYEAINGALGGNY